MPTEEKVAFENIKCWSFLSQRNKGNGFYFWSIKLVCVLLGSEPVVWIPFNKLKRWLNNIPTALYGQHWVKLKRKLLHSERNTLQQLTALLTKTYSTYSFLCRSLHGGWRDFESSVCTVQQQERTTGVARTTRNITEALINISHLMTFKRKLSIW